jgi:hypothetical protein
MFPTIAYKIMRSQIWFHLVFPLIAGGIIEALCLHFLGEQNNHVFVYSVQDRPKLPDMFEDVFASLRGISFVFGVFFTYLCIAFVKIKKDTSTPTAGSSIPRLDRILGKAQSYFVVSSLPIKEYFDPVSQVYLARVIKKKLIRKEEFDFQRILLFYDEHSYRAHEYAFLDGYYANCFAKIHQQYNMPLGYVPPENIRSILDGLNESTKQEILRIWFLPKKIACNSWLINHAPLRWLRIKQKIFILVNDGHKETVVLIEKKGLEPSINELTEENTVNAYADFVKNIKKEIYDPTGTVLKEDNDFIRFCLD